MQRKRQILDCEIYWRSDTRSPEEILKTGFQTRFPSNKDNWWIDSIRDRFPGLMPPDVDSQTCICISASLHGAALFPFHETASTTYIYAIALPRAQKIDSNAELISTKTISNTKNMVIDLHSYQTEQTRILLETQPEKYAKDPNLRLVACLPLYAYEAITYEIKPENIVAAVKVTRGDQKSQVIKINLEGAEKKIPSYFYEIKLDTNIIINPRFKTSETLEGVSDNNAVPIDLLCNYLENQKYALQFFDHESKKKKLFTTRVLDGLGGKTFTSIGSKFFKDDSSNLQVYDPRSDNRLNVQKNNNNNNNNNNDPNDKYKI